MSGYLLGSVPRILEQRSCAHEDEWVEPLRVMVFFPVFFFADCNVFDVNRTRRLGLNELVSFREIELVCGGSASEQGPLTLFLHLSLLSSAVCPFLCKNEHFSSNSQPVGDW